MRKSASNFEQSKIKQNSSRLMVNGLENQIKGGKEASTSRGIKKMVDMSKK